MDLFLFPQPCLKVVHHRHTFISTFHSRAQFEIQPPDFGHTLCSQELVDRRIYTLIHFLDEQPHLRVHRNEPIK